MTGSNIPCWYLWNQGHWPNHETLSVTTDVCIHVSLSEIMLIAWRVLLGKIEMKMNVRSVDVFALCLYLIKNLWCPDTVYLGVLIPNKMSVTSTNFDWTAKNSMTLFTNIVSCMGKYLYETRISHPLLWMRAPTCDTWSGTSQVSTCHPSPRPNTSWHTWHTGINYSIIIYKYTN